MENRILIVTIFHFLFSPYAVQAAAWTGILDPSRATDWSTAGVTGGIPNRTTICTTIAPYNGTAATINNAINTCPLGQVVKLAAGTFNLTTGIELDRGVTLRGVGAVSTVLKITGPVGVSCHIGDGRTVNICANGGNIGVDSAENTATWTSGYAQGTTVITLSGHTNLTVGHTIWLDQLDDTSDYPAAGDVNFCGNSTNNCSNQGGGAAYARSNRSLVEGQRVVACGTSTPGAACTSNTLTIFPGLRAPTFRTSQSPGAWWGNAGTILVGAGLEDMTIDSTGGGNGIYLINATDSWVKGVRMMRSDTTGSESRLTNLINAMNVTVQDSYFYGPQASQVISIYGMTLGPISGSVIQNNIFHSQLNPMVLNSTFYGNVIAYNYFDSTVLTNTQPSMIEHAIGAMNLYEGNNGKNFSSDIIHAPHYFETLFRNHFDGNTHNQSNTETQAGIALYARNRFFNAVGNVLGAANWNTYQTDQAHNTRAIFETGWQGTGSGTPVVNDPRVSTTLMRWGNWDSVTNSTRFLASEVTSGLANFANPVPASQTLPASFYMSSQPGWWATSWGTPKWPAIGPDVTGGNITNSPTGGHADKIPARLCFENTAVDPAFLASNPRIKLFNAGACYASGTPPPSGTINAASCSQTDVQTAVNAAADGSTILIPNGSCAWTTGIVTTKQIWIRAQNYTPTPGGNATRNVIITNNASVPLFDFTTGNSFHVALSGIRVNEGTGTNNALEVSGSGSKVALISDMFFEVKQRNGSSTDISVVDWAAQGGVLWNTRFQGIGTGGVAGVGPDGASFVIKSQPRVWTTASTMGTLDTNGDVNLYVEDSSCFNVGQFPDADDHGRAVFRHDTIDGCSGLTHGFTSAWGGRHIEWYDNTFSVTEVERNHNGRYFWIRAGTLLLTDNAVNNAANPGAYGNVSLFTIGDNTSPGTYPMPRQPGFGHNGTSNVSDPIYSWNNTGARANAFGFANGWDSIVLVNRDVFVNNGAKPGYAKYTYPHPARSALGTPPPPVGSACDLNTSGLTDVADVQLCANQAIGVYACTTGDINQDSTCNVVDVQRVVNAALGGACVTQ